MPFLTRQKNPSTTDMLCRPNLYSPEHDEQFQSFDHPASMLPQEPLSGVLLLPSYRSLQNSSKGELTWSSIEYLKVAMCSGFHICTQTCCNWRPNTQENKQFKSSQNLNECTLNAHLPQQHQDLQLHIPFEPHRQTSCALFRVHP